MLHSLAHLLANVLPGSNLQMNLLSSLALNKVSQCVEYDVLSALFLHFQLRATTSNRVLYVLLWQILSYT